MQNEHKVVRLEWQAIHVNYSYLLDEMAPAQLVPHLVERRLLTPEKAKEVKEKGSRLQKVSTILQALFVNRVLGRLPTFCAALISAGQPHIAERLADSECCVGIYHLLYLVCSPLFVHAKEHMNCQRQPYGCS